MGVHQDTNHFLHRRSLVRELPLVHLCRGLFWGYVVEDYWRELIGLLAQRQVVQLEVM